MKTKLLMLVSLKMTGWYKKIILSAFALILVSGSLSAQRIRVAGRVTDNAGLPVPGVTVLIEGTTTGVAVITSYSIHYTKLYEVFNAVCYNRQQ